MCAGRQDQLHLLDSCIILQGKIILHNLVLRGRAMGSFRDLLCSKENWKANHSYMKKHMLGSQSKLFPSLKFNCLSFCAGIPMWWDLAFKLPVSGLENYSRPGCKWFETGTKTTGWVKLKKISFYDSLGSCRVVGVQFCILFSFKETINPTFYILEEQMPLKTIYPCL